MQGKLTGERMCWLAGVSRAGFYRSLEERQPLAADLEVRAEIQQIFTEHKRRYGYRRVSAELRRRGFPRIAQQWLSMRDCRLLWSARMTDRNPQDLHS